MPRAVGPQLEYIFVSQNHPTDAKIRTHTQQSLVCELEHVE